MLTGADTIVFTPLIKNLPTADCTIEVVIDGGAPIPASSPIASAPAVSVPAGSRFVEVRVTPTSADYWPLVGLFEIQAPGNLVRITTPAEFAPPTGVSGPLGSAYSVIIHLSRLRETTSSALAGLAPVPANRINHVPAAWPPATGGMPAGAWPPTAWDSPQHDALRTIANPPLAAGKLQLSAGSLDPSTDDLVVELKNVAAPRTLTVSWPEAVARSDLSPGAPFLVYFHANVTQNFPAFYPAGSYPFGFDYVYFGLWRYINYVGDPLTVDPFCKGLPYQSAAAGKQPVLVLPGSKVPEEIGVFLNASTLEDVLGELQAFMFRRRGAYLPHPLGRCGLAGFSASCGLVAQFLANAANRASPFYLDTLKEVYFFDPPGSVAPDCVGQAKAWSLAGGNADKMTRCYTQAGVGNISDLIGLAPPAAPYVIDSADGLKTAGVFPSSVWHQAAAAAGNPVMAAGANAWQDTHQLISAMLLTDALRRSRFS